MKLNGNHLFTATLLLVLTIGCSEKPTIRKDNNGAFLDLSSAVVTKVSNQEWRVGKKRDKSTVSKGFLTRLTLPPFSRDDLEMLVSEFGVDSFLIRISRDTRERSNQFIGHYKIVFRVKTGNSTRLKAPRESQFRIFYAATSLSERFLKFPCPAFGHRKVINRIEVEKSSNPGIQVISTGRVYAAKNIEETGFIPQVFNGGTSLKGLYNVSFALYNSRRSTLMTDFVKLGSSVLVSSEEEISIPSCNGFTVPEKKDEPSLKDIKFN